MRTILSLSPCNLLKNIPIPYSSDIILLSVINPRRACAARVTVVVLCVCVCFRGPHMQLTQLSDKVGILAVLVSCSLVLCGVVRITAFWRS